LILAKSLILKYEKSAIVLTPATYASTSPDFCIFLDIILLPASPKPRESKAPILTIVFSRILVSKPSNSSLFFYNSLSIFFNASSCIASSSSIFDADYGFIEILLTFSSILSIGASTYCAASSAKKPDIKGNQSTCKNSSQNTAITIKIRVRFFTKESHNVPLVRANRRRTCNNFFFTTS